MKATIEFDTKELKIAIETGTLLALANAVGEEKEELKAEVKEALKQPVKKAEKS